ncbi:EAL domain-containing protein [Pseudoalteromonas fenneropenaei]|uniref:EAL domain-containing protein n=1 Tax=Pseudoalteromonas fenneropenaei TaxID=1737459 RepID=A0ABV7CIR7_9GAMM
MAKHWRSRFTDISLAVSSNTLVLSLREGYIALIPFFIGAALITLAAQLVYYLKWQQLSTTLATFDHFIWAAFPILMLLSISYHLSKNLRLNTIAVPILVLSCFVSTSGYFSQSEHGIVIDQKAGVVYTLLLPIVCCYALEFMLRAKWLRLVEVGNISLFLRKHLNLILPYVLLSAAVLFGLPLLESALNGLGEALVAALSGISSEAKLMLKLLVSHLFWFFGIHGDNTYGVLFPTELDDFLLFNGVDGQQLYTAFVIMGGTGCLWGLILAIYWQKVTPHHKQIAKLAAPFAVFNISEVMLYALPLVLNPFLIIPFFVTPLFNAVLTYWVVSAGWLEFHVVAELPWFTPVFISGWWLSDGPRGALWQLCLVILNASLYTPFLRLHSEQSLSGKASDLLVKRYAAGRLIEEQTESHFATHQSKADKSAHSLAEVSEALNSGELTLHYQPKLNPHTGRVLGFEALLRLRTAAGDIQGPWFLAVLHEHKLMHIIDNFVIDKLEVDLAEFAKRGFRPKVSFNITPEHLLAGGYRRIIKAFSQFPEQVEVELLESSYIEDFDKTLAVVTELKRNHIRCAMDDFGTGYSCLSVLANLTIDTIKLDKSLLPSKGNSKGLVLYKNLAALCEQLGFKLVAEGVETKQDEDAVKEARIDCVQGFLYSKAVSFEDAAAVLVQQRRSIIA